MPERPPFDFDMRVSADKKRRKAGRAAGSAAGAGTRLCDFAGCGKPGEHRAPKSPERLDEFWWFCKDHAREYNLKWNFFQGTTDAEFAEFLSRDRVWGRATQPFGRKPDEGRAWARMGISDPADLLGEKATQNPGRAPTVTRKLPSTERKALEILDARDTWTRTEIRRQYKSLVKDLHPDMNGGDRKDEERLQEVVWAWDQIKDSRHFRE
jgi:hypothetical protein